MADQTPLPISGDRNAPEPVAPVIRHGVRFEQNLTASEAEFGQVGGVLTARDAKTGAVLWSIKVYENKRRPDIEGDVQDVFFRSMRFDSKGRLVIENENGQRFVVDVDKRKVTPLR
jgi:outer membrane protein assembly factor BamB